MCYHKYMLYPNAISVSLFKSFLTRDYFALGFCYLVLILFWNLGKLPKILARR